MGKWSLYLQKVFCIGIITLTANTDVSPSDGEFALTLLVLHIHTVHLQCILLHGPYFVVSPGTTRPSNAPTITNQVG
jgi:hypothetical protein